MDRPETAEISFRQLFLFEAIGELKSVRRASEECSLSQPAVTQSLAKLERHLNVHLVDRRASGSYLNELGQIFHRRIKRFTEQSEAAIVELGAATTLLSARPIMKRLTRSQVRMLIATVENIAFEHVPAVLGISSASIQRAARDLEANLHVPLFYRTANGMVVNPTGVAFGRKMKLALQEVESGIEELKEAQHKESRKIVIGAMPFGGSVLLASVLEEFLQIHPRVDVKITNEGAAEMIKALISGDVDFVIGLLLETVIGELTYEALAPTPYTEIQ